MVRAVAALALMLLANTGCSSPCEDLAEVACVHAGAASTECQEIQAKAAKASPDDKAACRKALDLVEDLVKVR